MLPHDRSSVNRARFDGQTGHKRGSRGQGSGHTSRHLEAPKAMAATAAITAPTVARAFFFSSSDRFPFLAFSILHSIAASQEGDMGPGHTVAAASPFSSSTETDLSQWISQKKGKDTENDHSGQT